MNRFEALIFFLSIYCMFSQGCTGCKALPIVCETPFPNTNLTVILGGPVGGETYCYYICDANGDCHRTRLLGKLGEVDLASATIDSQGSGVFRIRWGSRPNSPFAIFDVEKSIYISDSNPENTSNEPFERELQ